jgi:hypothetical protein
MDRHLDRRLWSSGDVVRDPLAWSRYRFRSPDFAQDRTASPVSKKLRRAGCPRPRILRRGVMAWWSIELVRSVRTDVSLARLYAGD